MVFFAGQCCGSADHGRADQRQGEKALHGTKDIYILSTSSIPPLSATREPGSSSPPYSTGLKGGEPAAPSKQCRLLGRYQVESPAGQAARRRPPRLGQNPWPMAISSFNAGAGGRHLVPRLP